VHLIESPICLRHIQAEVVSMEGTTRENASVRCSIRVEYALIRANR
jgi:hypothetical protein